MPVISCLNAKGGTGKTTSAINLAAVAAYRGYTVHVLDADAEQGTASEWIEYANDAFEENPNAPPTLTSKSKPSTEESSPAR